MTDFDKLRQIALRERNLMVNKYNGNLMGKCIEASDQLYELLIKAGFNAKPQQVWCLYELFENCTDICYEEHWLTYVLYKGRRVYIDVTMDQFQWAFSRKLPEIYFDTKLPRFYLIKEPGKVTLDRCGWNDWYNYGDYVNNFNYWD